MHIQLLDITIQLFSLPPVGEKAAVTVLVGCSTGQAPVESINNRWHIVSECP